MEELKILNILPAQINKVDKLRQIKVFKLDIKKNKDSWQVAYVYDKELKGRPYDGLGYSQSTCLYYTCQPTLLECLDTMYNILIYFKHLES